MRIKNLFAAAVISSTLLGGVPLQAGSPYVPDHRPQERPSPRYDDRDSRYVDRDYRRDDRIGDRRGRESMMKIASATTRSREYQNELFQIDTGRRFSAIVFRVDRGDVALDRIRVTFNDDTAFIPDTKVVFNEGDRTCRIDLPGHDRGIKWVRIRYQSLSREPAVVDVYGVVAN